MIDEARDRALNAMWKAWSCHLAIEGLGEVLLDTPEGLDADKAAARAQFIVIAQGFMEKTLEQKMFACMAQLQEWAVLMKQKEDADVTV